MLNNDDERKENITLKGNKKSGSEMKETHICKYVIYLKSFLIALI
jgi:hypothetical protein